MIRPDLDALAALLDKATLGPWQRDICQVDKAWLKGRLQEGCCAPDGGVVAVFAESAEDADLVVAAVNALPALIARVRELERERDQSTLNRACADALVSAAQDMTRAAALAMRERCAQACEERALIYDGLESDASTRYFSDKMRGARNAAEECAAAIRALET